MKKIIIMAVALLSVVPAMAQVAEALNNYENFIQVTGRAEKEVVPDEIYIDIVINESEMKVSQTVEKLEQDMIAAIKRLGIDTDSNLKIDNMSSNYRDYFLRKNRARTYASYQLKVDGASMLGSVYQVLESLGISNISITKLSHSRINEFQEEVRVEAMRNAQAVARSLAEAVGQTVGRAVYIVDYNSDFYIPAPQARADVALYRTAAVNETYQTELDFREIKLTYNITAKFELK